MVPGREIGIRIDQTLTQDATGTMVMLELEAMGLDHVRTELSAQYVDHNLLQADFRNADDHLFLHSACRRFGLWYSKPGNGVSHPVHMQRFGIPGKTLLGSDSHTCAAGSLGMLAIGAGGLEVAMAMAGEPFHLVMPQIWGVRLVGELPDWVSAKDVILEMLRRHDVTGGLGRIIEYSGPGLARLSAMDRHVIANMGAELGATATVFPSDDEVQRFLASEERARRLGRAARRRRRDLRHRGGDRPLDRSSRSSRCRRARATWCRCARWPGAEVFQCVIGSSANPGLRDFAIAALIVDGQPDPRPGVVRRQPDVAPDARDARRRGLPPQADHRGRAHPPGRLHGLHRHGPGAGHRPHQPAHDAPQLPGPVGHARGPGVPLQPGDRGRVRAHRRDHRPARPRHAVPALRAADARRTSTPRCSCRRPTTAGSRCS